MASDIYSTGGYDTTSNGGYGTGVFDGGVTGYGGPGMPAPQIVDPTAPQGAAGAMPPGMDPRLWALFQKYGKTPTGAGSGITDWSYWQNDAVRNASGDWDYVLGRLEKDFQGNGPDEGGGGAPGGGGPGGGVSPTSQWKPDPRVDSLYDQLLARSTQSLNINPGDPIIRNQVDSYSAADTRSQNNYLADLAERGGGNANLSMEQRMSSEKIGQDTAGFQGQLMSNELSARRNEISQALSQMGSLLSDQERMSLENELAIMNNLLGQAGIKEGAYEFDQNNKYRWSPVAH